MERWWKGAIIYQIYIRSFKDSNNDGIGDLRGIIQKLNYIKQLGCEAIWLSPFYKSPMYDFGYDVSDYHLIDPSMGTMKDFEELVKKAHAYNIKIILDMVLNHTSVQHPWFIESKKNRTNKKADWYVWADPAINGDPPNNWISIFGGSAWTFAYERNQYYLHSFFKAQPNLNYYCYDIHKIMLKIIKFWLDKDIDGLRLDAINFLYHDRSFRDNPLRSTPSSEYIGKHKGNPYAFQYHIYDNTRPETLTFVNQIRQLLDIYPGTISIGEIGSDNSMATAAQYIKGENYLHMAYTGDLLADRFSAYYLRSIISRMEKLIGDKWPCWLFSTHDVPRSLSRFPYARNDNFAVLLLKLLCSLRGTIIIYQGEELALTEVVLPLKKIKDQYGLNFYPYFKGRDGSRTPLPWNTKKPYAGFSNVDPWLPIGRDHFKKAISFQEQSPQSTLNQVREFLFWRKQHPELIYGNIYFLNVKEPILAFYRVYLNVRILCLFNLSDSIVKVPAEISKLIEQSIWEKTNHLNKRRILKYGVGYFGIA